MAELELVRLVGHTPMRNSIVASDGLTLAEQLVREHLNLTARADLDAVDANVSSDFFNHRCADEPMEALQHGPNGLRATIRWLHRAFTDMRFEFDEVLVTGDRAVARVTLQRQATCPFVVHDSAEGRITGVFPSKGRAFAAPQSHWFRIADGAMAEHDAVRDDLGMAKQLGWIPPTPAYIIRMLWARRRERRRSKA